MITFTELFIVSEIHFSRDIGIKLQIRTNPEFRLADISAVILEIPHRSQLTTTT